MEEIIEKLKKLIQEGEEIISMISSDEREAYLRKTERWANRCKDFLEKKISIEEGEKLHDAHGRIIRGDTVPYFVRLATAKIDCLRSLQEDITNNPDYWKEKLDIVQQIPDKEEKVNSINIVQRICDHFHLVANQLKRRYDNRTTLRIKDEYDVQDLMHALLKIFFEDIRTEEWTPSYAGGSARMDFLLKKERFVIETKKTRKGLGIKELGEQLIVDIVRYNNHPDCKTLFCFIYDPEEVIQNPKGFENDLSRREGNLKVKVFIAPKR